MLTVFATSKFQRTSEFSDDIRVRLDVLDEFPTNYEPTVFDNFACVVHRGAGASYNLELFDTAGQEEWEQLRRMMYANTDVFLVCYSCVQPSSFDNVEKKWMPDLRNHDPTSLVILVALCTDLRTKLSPDLVTSPSISTRQGADLAKRLKCNAFIECSSMLRFHVREVFDCAIDVFERDFQRNSDQYCDDRRQCRSWLCCLMCCPRRKHKKRRKSIEQSTRLSSHFN